MSDRWATQMGVAICVLDRFSVDSFQLTDFSLYQLIVFFP